jgi:hypothetical protein
MVVLLELKSAKKKNSLTLDGLGTLGIKDSCSIYLLEKPA